MSSFVISKGEYIKAAAFCAAAIEAKNYYREPVVYLWNSRKNRPYNAEDVRAEFARLFTINARAVCEQYHDAEPETDAAKYAELFTETKAAAALLFHSGYTMGNSDARLRLQRTVYGLIHFFRSAQYQIEGDEFTKSALRILNKWYRGMYEVLRKLDGISTDELESWGSFPFFDDDLSHE